MMLEAGDSWGFRVFWDFWGKCNANTTSFLRRQESRIDTPADQFWMP